MKPAIQRALAQRDITQAFEHYFGTAGSAIAADFVQEMDACMQRIERFPAAGSPRYSVLLDVEGLRFSVVERFPYLVFYLEREEYVDIIRVLHQRLDIPDVLGEL